MKLEIFDHAQRRGASRVQYSAVSINRRNARVTFSQQASEELSLTTDHAITFAKDSDSKCDWYISIKKDDPTGLPVRCHHGGSNAKGYSSLGITCRSLTGAILDGLKAKSGATVLIAQKPTVIDGQEWYQLIMAKPIRIN